jgi:hypothetical protein
MDSLTSFLNNNQPTDNKNQKFVDSSPTASVFARTGYDFTPSDPTILELTPAALKHLNSMPKFIKDWQAEDMRNGTVTDYYKNPVNNITTAIVNNIAAIRAAIPTKVVQIGDENSYITEVQCAVPELTSIYDQSNVSIAQAQSFIAHTNRLSNMAEITPETAALPHYNTALAIGKQLLYVVNQTDHIQNNAPILGTFTSLFVEPELMTFNTNIDLYAEAIANSITITVSPITEGGGGESSYSSNLTSTQIETINDKLKEIKVFFEKRRKHDENFWTKAQAIVDEYQKLKSINTGGETHDKLVRGYVGSDNLKSKLLIKDVPVQPKYNVSVSYLGNITYTGTDPTINSYTIPSVVTRTTAITGTLTYYTELPTTGLVIGDEYYITTTGETWRWNGTTWIFISKVDPNSPIVTLEDYINYYSANTLHLSFNGYDLDLSVGSLIFNSDNGVWADNVAITITNTGTKNYIFSDVIDTNFLNAEIQYYFSNVSSNTIAVGNSATFTVSARSLTEGDTTDYGVITIVPGINIQTKITSNVAAHGILLPGFITQNVGSPSTRLPINVVSGPYQLLAADSSSPDFWTWRNDSQDPVTISTITNITDANSTDDMTITFYQATTPNTINVNDSVLWYANVNAHVEFPNTATYRVTTTDGQQRILSIGVDPGNVDDSNLYNEIINTNPDIVVTNNYFSIRVYGGKANTVVNYSGPNISGTKLLSANGYTILANNRITSNGTYTYVFDFVGTGHRRTITKAIYS